MQKGVSFFLTFLFILPFILLIPLESSAQILEEKMVVIKGTDDWKNTKIRLYPNDKVTIKTTGKVCFHKGINNSCVNADGWDVNDYQNNWIDDWQECDDPIKTVNHAALIGNVGSDDFLIGKEANFTGKDGFLYLRVNDCSLTGDFGNSGQFEVFISVKHIK